MTIQAAPRIAVTGMWSNQVHGLRFGGNAVSVAVLRSVIRGGAEPLTLFAESALTPRRRLAEFDGLLVPGGADVNPARYGEAALETTQTADSAAQDDFEAEMVDAALELGIPVLAICRGFQLVNVEHGGRLVQDLPADSVHRNGTHVVDIVSDSRLAGIVGATRVSVSSYHHQAVQQVGGDLVAVGTAPDGVVEAFEHPDRNLIAVQWHPEDTAEHDAQQQAIFAWLVAEARLVQNRREGATR